jgi:hypothetical protein
MQSEIMRVYRDHECPADDALDVYGAFVPTGADRDHAEKAATEYEERRRAAK